MSNTKTCPACQKELPVLAVRCKYCGLKQPLKHSDPPGEATKHTTKPLKTASKSTTPPSAAARPYSTLQPKSVTDRRVVATEKKTMMGFSPADEMKPYEKKAKPSRSGPSTKRGAKGPGPAGIAGEKDAAQGANVKPSIAPVAQRQSSPGRLRNTNLSGPPGAKKTMVGVARPSYVPPKPKPRPTSVQAKKERKSASALSAVAPPRPSNSTFKPAVTSSAKPRQMPVPSSRLSEQRIHKSEDTTGEDWIPEIEDDSQIITLLEDGTDSGIVDLDAATQELDFDDLSVVTDGDSSRQQDKETVVAPLKTDMATTVMKFLTQPLRTSPNASVTSTGWIHRLKRLHLLIAVVAAGLVIVLILLVAGSQGSKRVQADGSSDASNGESEANGKESQNRSGGKAGSLDGVDAARVGGTNREKSSRASKRGCKPFSAYAPFLWDKYIKRAVSHFGGLTVCDILGLDAKSIRQAFDDVTTNFSTGYDGLPGGSAVELYPSGETSGIVPRISFVFFKDKLFRVIFEYRNQQDIDIEMARFEELWGMEAQRVSLPEQHIVAIDDGEIRLELVEDRIGKKDRRLVISDLKVDEKLAQQLDAVWKATQKTAEGDRLFNQEAFEQAAKKYIEATQVNDAYAAGFIGLANAQMRLEDFDAASKNASHAAKVSEDTRLIAKAYRMIAIAMLYAKNIDQAVLALKKAVQNDRSVKEYVTALKELETGSYGTERVARNAARLSCLKTQRASAQGVLVRGNFVGTKEFFSALRNAKKDIQFETLKRRYVLKECR